MHQVSRVECGYCIQTTVKDVFLSGCIGRIQLRLGFHGARDSFSPAGTLKLNAVDA